MSSRRAQWRGCAASRRWLAADPRPPRASPCATIGWARPGWCRRADTTVAMPPPFSGLRISRQVQVLSGAGHARMMRTRSVVSAPRACRGGGYRRFRRNARAPWVNCWRRPSPLGAGPRCPWIGSRHGMTWQRPTACSRMGAAVRLLLSPFFATSCARGGARAASRFGSVAEICRRALAATLALTAGALPARAPRPCKPCGRMRRLAGSSPMAWHWRLRGPQRLPT